MSVKLDHSCDGSKDFLGQTIQTSLNISLFKLHILVLIMTRYSIDVSPKTVIGIFITLRQPFHGCGWRVLEIWLHLVITRRPLRPVPWRTTSPLRRLVSRINSPVACWRICISKRSQGAIVRFRGSMIIKLGRTFPFQLHQTRARFSAGLDMRYDVSL